MGGRGGRYFTKKDTDGVLKTMRDAGLTPAVSVAEAQKILNSKKYNSVAKFSRGMANQSQSKGVLTIGGQKMNSIQDIDSYYDKQVKETSRMLGINNAQNRILGTSGGITVGGKLFTSEKQVRDHYKKEREKAKRDFNKL